MSEKPRILVVDDEQVVLDSARRMLSAEGFPVRLVGDAESALTALREEPADIVISDIMLPGISGIEFMETVHREDPNLVVIITTGYSTVENGLDSMRKGAFDFLPKPFTFDELLSPVYRARRYLELPLATRVALSSAASGGDYALGRHSWARVEEGGALLLGLTSFLIATMGRIESIEFPDRNAEVRQGGRLAGCKSADGLTHVVWSPLSGRVIEVNEALRRSSDLSPQAPAAERWLVHLLPADLERELGNLAPG